MKTEFEVKIRDYHTHAYITQSLDYNIASPELLHSTAVVAGWCAVENWLLPHTSKAGLCTQT